MVSKPTVLDAVSSFLSSGTEQMAIRVYIFVVEAFNVCNHKIPFWKVCETRTMGKKVVESEALSDTIVWIYFARLHKLSRNWETQQVIIDGTALKFPTWSTSSPRYADVSFNVARLQADKHYQAQEQILQYHGRRARKCCEQLQMIVQQTRNEFES